VTHHVSVPVFARTHVLETTPEAHDRGLELLDDLLPWLRETTGYRGMVRLASKDRSTTVVITFWADEAAMAESDASGRTVGGLAAEAAGAKRIALHDYEVTFSDIALEPDAARDS